MTHEKVLNVPEADENRYNWCTDCGSWVTTKGECPSELANGFVLFAQALFEATAWLAVARLGRMDMHARDILRDGRHGKSEPDPYWAGWVEPTDWVSYSDQEWERRRAKEQIS